MAKAAYSVVEIQDKIANADELEAQLIMAKITGNFKRGNEKIIRKSRYERS